MASVRLIISSCLKKILGFVMAKLFSEMNEWHYEKFNIWLDFNFQEKLIDFELCMRPFLS